MANKLNYNTGDIFEDKEGNRFILFGFCVPNQNYIASHFKYWEHHSVPEDQWIKEEDVDWTKYERVVIGNKSQSLLDGSYIDPLVKYHNSF